MAPEASTQPDDDDDTIMIEELKSDLDNAGKKLKKLGRAGFVEGEHLRTWLTMELLPVLADTLIKMDQQEEALLSAFEEQELILPENAMALLAALEAGEQLAAFTETLGAPGVTAEVQKAELAKLVATYRHLKTAAEKVLDDLTGEGEPAEPDAGGDE